MVYNLIVINSFVTIIKILYQSVDNVNKNNLGTNAKRTSITCPHRPLKVACAMYKRDLHA